MMLTTTTITLILCTMMLLYSMESRISSSLLSATATAVIPMHCPTILVPGTNFSFLCDDPAVSFLQLASFPPSRPSRPKILCLVLTQSKNHATRMQAVVDTWGRKCDTLIGASDVTDPSLHTYKIESLSGYWGIWDKLMHTLRGIVEHQFSSQQLLTPMKSYDWILKADDDTYVIMENLYAFLANLTPSNEPRIYGRTMAWPRLKRFQDMEGWFPKKSPNHPFGKRFYAKLGMDETLRFSHGGPGYIMNLPYARTLVDAYFNVSENAVKGEVAEDIANAVTMLYHGIRPRSTVDLASGLERMHPESPQTMFANPIWLERMHHGIKGSLRGEGEKCCSPTSISYHYVADFQMRLFDYQLYHCPRRKND